MERYVLPSLGNTPVNTVGTRAIDAVLRPLALAGKSATTSLTGQQIARVLREAAIAAYRDISDPVSIVVASLPKRKGHIRHARALDHSDVGAALAKIDASGSRTVIKLAIRFLALTAARQIEVRKARWDQIDFETATWVVPPEDMKKGRQHRVPLSTQAIDVLRRARKLLPRGEQVFPGKRGSPMIGEITIAGVLSRAGIGASGHGFRSSFRTWAQERDDMDHHVAELCLSHAGAYTATEQAYARSDLLEKRRDVMQAWADAIS